MAILSNSFKSFCISACIFMMLISLGVNFVIGLGIFPTSMSPPVDNMTTGSVLGENATSVASGQFFSFMLSLEAITGSVVGIGVVIYALASKSFNLIAAYIFSAIFWFSWVNNLFLMDYVTSYDALIPIYVMLTTVMGLLFVGAVTAIMGGTE